jgi:hypothetical protein
MLECRIIVAEFPTHLSRQNDLKEIQTQCAIDARVDLVGQLLPIIQNWLTACDADL